MQAPTPADSINCEALAADIKQWGSELGFQHTGISRIHLGDHPGYLKDWLAKGYQGEMNYLARNRTKRSDPAELIPGTVSIITVRMNYLPSDTKRLATLANPRKAYISRYALGRDYHKLMRKRLVKLVQRIETVLDQPDFSFRVFSDSAPVLEKALAQSSGSGWIGKNTLLIDREAGSWFFLGEIYTDLKLPADSIKAENHCGSCRACLDRCPTGALIGPYQLDARRCISYLTIELKSSIPLPLRPLMGNRIFGCDDCQLTCPWNRFEQRTAEGDFEPRHQLDSKDLCELFAWTEEQYQTNTTGSAIRRVGYEGWLRNIAVALGNAPADPAIVMSLAGRLQFPSEMVVEHVTWALARQESKLSSGS
ncbi:MAG: tRNA epoxyqueuosine(34) reductase QueG [Pseudomonadales bacterium]|jgi:epoxyqueuosine reductase|nr:tRNA epoxyqueuosine(34) reductase QueG [Pseudomonadales bacterium]MDP7144037.1 tRNA epoxyqueuosine(34) reductase QueG [Pseudomonadales bacterium]MDP7595556.1 tRNA epoxyqueuosine(34) reductase QueG [Pseudomonadales bacterium]HJN50923.1 tRNA epoxyqueuosine(34) reductase QueG [Pseudomonadales bacterium]|tara:strand:- start:6 stop:1103 length:1098 start_codon:yes stop_codon:yes gene_type:complete